MYTALRERARVRRMGREILRTKRWHCRASQSAKSTGVGGEQRVYDGGEKVKGTKRHLLVDTQGLVLKASRCILPALWTSRG
jgi:putative transposase